jgi:MoxR-like ATPase
MAAEGSLRYTPQIELEQELPTAAAPSELDVPDRRDGLIYDYDEPLKLAVEVALATGRPLLLRGEPGSGKSSLAAYVARNLGWRYYEHVVTAATRAEDLLWRFDAVRRLSDAQVRKEGDPPLVDHDYVEPGVLWWVFDRESARRRGASSHVALKGLAEEPSKELNTGRDADAAVVLIDELDKADPDVPNGLLVPLGSASFKVTETDTEIGRRPRTVAAAEADPRSRLLVVITTNEERDLPPAFLRRCVTHHLEHPDAERLVRIAGLHLAPDPMDEATTELCRTIAQRVEKLRMEAIEAAERPPSTAEFLDAVRACRTLGIFVGDSPEWRAVERATLKKVGRAPDAGGAG